jgi:membrane associated rhomboid family serine protease
VSRYRPTSTGFGIGGGWTPAVKTVVIICTAVFVLDLFAGGHFFAPKFGLSPAAVTHQFQVWQLVTYIFIHGSFFHILFNMFGLYMFGSELERLWGTRQFTKYFFICGIGAGLTSVIATPNSPIPIVGASGALFGLLLAYGVLFPNRIIYLYMIIPVPAKWLVIIIGAIAFLSSMSASGTGVAHMAHLGGMLFGFLYLKGGRFLPDLRSRYDRWHRARLRRKFDVYYNDRHRNDDDQEKYRRWRN